MHINNNKSSSLTTSISALSASSISVLGESANSNKTYFKLPKTCTVTIMRLRRDKYVPLSIAFMLTVVVSAAVEAKKRPNIIIIQPDDLPFQEGWSSPVRTMLYAPSFHLSLYRWIFKAAGTSSETFLRLKLIIGICNR